MRILNIFNLITSNPRRNDSGQALMQAVMAIAIVGLMAYSAASFMSSSINEERRQVAQGDIDAGAQLISSLAAVPNLCTSNIFLRSPFVRSANPARDPAATQDLRILLGTLTTSNRPPWVPANNIPGRIDDLRTSIDRVMIQNARFRRMTSGTNEMWQGDLVVVASRENSAGQPITGRRVVAEIELEIDALGNKIGCRTTTSVASVCRDLGGVYDALGVPNCLFALQDISCPGSDGYIHDIVGGVPQCGNALTQCPSGYFAVGIFEGTLNCLPLARNVSSLPPPPPPACVPAPPNNASMSLCPTGSVWTMCGTGGYGCSGSVNPLDPTNYATIIWRGGSCPAGYGADIDVSTGSCSLTQCNRDCIPSAGPPPPPPQCPMQTLTWTLAPDICSASFSAQAASSISPVVTDSVAPETGTAAFACDAAGIWAAAPQAGATCSSTPFNGRWQADGGCSAPRLTVPNPYIYCNGTCVVFLGTLASASVCNTGTATSRGYSILIVAPDPPGAIPPFPPPGPTDCIVGTKGYWMNPQPRQTRMTDYNDVVTFTCY